MASSFTAYDQLWSLANGDLDLKSDTLWVRLVTSSYTFDADHTEWDNGADDATDPSYNEVANGNGYTTGGIELSGETDDNDHITYDDVTWTALTKTFRAAILGATGTFGGVTNPVLGYLLLDTTPSDIVSNGSDYSILWNDTDGIFYRPSS